MRHNVSISNLTHSIRIPMHRADGFSMGKEWLKLAYCTMVDVRPRLPVKF